MMQKINKTCYKCHETKPIIEFAKRSGGKTPYRNLCVICNRAYARVLKTTPEQREKGRINMQKHRAVSANKERIREQYTARNKASPKNTFRLMIFNARKRAEVTITLDDLMGLWGRQSGRCAVTNIEMTWARGKIESTSISLDRINPDLSYTVDNIRLVCHAVNCFRGRMSDADMLAMAKAIVANLNKSAEATWDSFLAFIDESSHMVLQ